jgi:hypothetical protein
MPSQLTVTNEDPLPLTGSIDGAGALQFVHSSDSLADYSQTLEAEHDDYNESGGIVRVKLLDFSGGGSSWTLSASHDDGRVSWTRDGNHAYYDFPLVTGLVEVDTIATDGGSPPQTKTRKIWIKTTPTDPLPDGP